MPPEVVATGAWVAIVTVPRLEIGLVSWSQMQREGRGRLIELARDRKELGSRRGTEVEEVEGFIR